ncbi:MAG: nuclear transport factor 2 family protein [bacterium]|nr:nuclear transport factor 2 family protein [bacterium]
MNNVQEWHKLLDSGNLKDLKKILDKNVAFHSPVLFKPQVGRTVTAMYLSSAYNMFFADNNKTFTYIRELNSDNDSVLEFTCEIDGIQINGIDMIKWSDEGKITEFKVMIRPMKAIELVKSKMFELLSQLSAIDKLKLKAGATLDKIG